jgi:Holliday junction resolvase RusA-like endonuclease
VTGRPALLVIAHGIPAPQGSKTPLPNGRMKESSAKVKPWRDAVVVYARRAAGPGWQTLDGPLVAEMVFSLPRGATVRRADPTVPPDLSKLIRSTEDALTDACVWADDARVVAYHQPRKVYVGDRVDPDALARPGAVIRIWPLATAPTPYRSEDR